MRPYLSLDIETTGVDIERSDILELGFVYDDGKSEGHKLIKHNFVLDLESISFASFSALHMNARLIERINKKENLTSVDDAFSILRDVVEQASLDAQNYDEYHGRKRNPRISLAGKNVASFDLPIIKNFIRRWINLPRDPFLGVTGSEPKLATTLRNIERKLQHRVLDVGSMYAADFGYVPSLPEIMQQLDPTRTSVSHIAVEDAMDVVNAIRHKAWAVNHDEIYPKQCVEL